LQLQALPCLLLLLHLLLRGLLCVLHGCLPLKLPLELLLLLPSLTLFHLVLQQKPPCLTAVCLCVGLYSCRVDSSSSIHSCA
jgi:hypothetical protein